MEGTQGVDVAFAEEARQAISGALLRMANGHYDDAAAILEKFGARCVRIVARAELAQDQADLSADRFDLGALNSTVNLRDHQPEREED